MLSDNLFGLDRISCRVYPAAVVAPSSVSLRVIQESVIASTALQEPRRSLLAALREPDSAAGLARKLGMPRQRLNYHLRALERCGLVECVEERRKGNCTERILRATAKSFVIGPDALGALGATPEAAADRFSASFVVAVAARTIQEVSNLETRARRVNKRLATFTLDSVVRFTSADARAAFAAELSEHVAELVARYHDSAAPGGRRFRLVTLLHPEADLRKEQQHDSSG